MIVSVMTIGEPRVRRIPTHGSFECQDTSYFFGMFILMCQKPVSLPGVSISATEVCNAAI